MDEGGKLEKEADLRVHAEFLIPCRKPPLLSFFFPSLFLQRPVNNLHVISQNNMYSAMCLACTYQPEVMPAQGPQNVWVSSESVSAH